MPNRPRPRCPEGHGAMEPLFMQRERGESFLRVKEVFACRECGAVGKGRERTVFITADGRRRNG